MKKEYDQFSISSTGVNSLFIDIAALGVYAIRNRKTNT